MHTPDTAPTPALSVTERVLAAEPKIRWYDASRTEREITGDLVFETLKYCVNKEPTGKWAVRINDAMGPAVRRCKTRKEAHGVATALISAKWEQEREARIQELLERFEEDAALLRQILAAAER